ncbi:photosynthetic complex assembly protein PuhC [Aestuariicoccus sp. MJ-SS9]|uniref:photosynthetic complex assembly protein PuhC n=1 Tax=Aestuariicoccus sp. MJ-SS9 TaxID=3079855 RepID=UPI002912B002|nr:photosynthetic complex assembly protein PuhC [Aestuariicoccus sp. MJ-SS9]MDU8910962.1 photosynthetic complex assembly protein PuhC [Aestuariicoccus sp. MJ-SS9]
MSDTTNPPRIHAQDRELVPRVLVRLMTSLVILCLIMVSAHVWTGQPKDAVPPKSDIVMERVLFLQGDMSGAARVLDANGSLIADLSPEEGGFLSGIWRVLQRERTKARVGLDGSIRVTAMENGRMAITDPSTGWSADLMGFGQDNAAAFAKLLLN